MPSVNHLGPIHLFECYRRDKKFFKPSIIEQWVIVVYESERRFPKKAAEEMANGFCEGAVSVGKRSSFFSSKRLLDIFPRKGMQVKERRPLIVYENGQGIIGNVCNQRCTSYYLFLWSNLFVS